MIMKCTQERVYTKEGMKKLFDFCLMDQTMQDELEPYWLPLAEKLDANDEVIETAITDWQPKTKDVNYKGVRMAIGAIFREACEVERLTQRMEAGEDVPRLYGVMPVILAPYQAIKLAAGDDAYVSFPDLLFMHISQDFLHHAEHIFEKAEFNGVTYGARHCALNKMGIAGRLAGIVPDPTVMWSWGLVCDEATKIDEFLKFKQNGDWTSIVTRYPHDTYWDETDYDNVERTKYLANSMKKAIKEAADAVGVVVKPEHTQQAVAEYMSYMRKVAKLSMLIAQSDPQPMRNNTLAVLTIPATFPLNGGYDYLEQALDVLIEEVEQAVADGYGVAPKGSPRCGMYFNPGNNPWFEALLNKNGVVINMCIPSTMSPHQLAPSKFEDPYEQMAEQWMHMNFGMGCGCDTRDWVDKVRACKCEGMIVGFLDYDRWLGQLQKVGAKIIEEELGIPTFYLEADFFDDRDYSEEAIRTRVETMCQIIKVESKKRRARLAAEQAK
jgi:benzoyl-CoA reductase/2-hydroxyglutaryl-CoA dehydratase subunit BcrC/BadD/HgdB